MKDDNKKNNQSTKRRTKNKRKIKIIIICSIILAILIGLCFFFGNNLLSKMKRVELDDSDLGIRPDITEKLKMDEINDIVNIAILGVDTTEDDVGRTDALMVATFDPVHEKLKVTSIMRDTYVDIPGYGKDKINHAHAYGGPELTIKTLNQNFGLNITDYVKINFEELSEIIDALGGIDMEMSKDEIAKLNRHLESAYGIKKLPVQSVSAAETGKVHLDGFQALGYCRIRSTDGGDFDRTERHRKIMAEMFNKISSAGTGQLTSMTTKLLPYVETSLSNKEIINLGANVLNLGTSSIEQERFPRDEYSMNSEIWTPSVGLNIFYLCYDEEYTEKQMYEYIFNDRKLWLEPNPKVYIHDNEHFHNTADPSSNYYVPNTDNNTNIDNTNNNNTNNDNTQDESTENNGTGGDNTQGDNTGNNDNNGGNNAENDNNNNGDVVPPNPIVP